MAKATFTFLLLFAMCVTAIAGSYTTTDGQTISGEPVSYDKNGVVIKLSSGSFAPRTAWTKFTQESLNALKAEAKRPQDVEFIDPYLEENVQQDVQRQVIEIKPVDRVERPTGSTGIFAGLKSPLWFTIMMILWGGNIFAGYAVGHFKNLAPAIGPAVAALIPFFGPIGLLFMPARMDYIERKQAQQADDEATALAAEQAAAAEAAHPPEEPHADVPAEHVHTPPPPATGRPQTSFSLPQQAANAPAPAPAQPTVSFRRGDFTFNRRFFETKMPGFFRVVPSEEDKDLVLDVKSLRGHFIAKRIPKITQTDLHLETFKGDATAEEVVPFVEIQEVQIRNKDAV
jgi:hypothetical protein